MNNLMASLLLDGYKTGHILQYPDNTEYVYSNMTARMSRLKGVDKVVLFGTQYLATEYLTNIWNNGFFNRKKEDVIKEYSRLMDSYIGPNAVPVGHIGELHDLGYLPIEVRALPEGSLVPIGVPMLTVVNTDPRFSWITNYLETIISAIIWKPITSATTANEYRKKFNEYAEKTGYDKEFVKFQGHDFSFRGMSGPEDAMISGAGHLLSFVGTDTVPAIPFLEQYYGADCQKELIGCTVPATEHSVMCMGQKESEIETFRRLITEVYPNGIVSIVSDTWDFWKVMTEYLPTLKNEILDREGRVVIRPDSGDPVDIICGDLYRPDSPGRKGAYELLWETFGGTINEKGYKVLNEKVGLIYGDSITLDRQDEILKRLEAKGFCASNLVLGIGSYTYEYVTRDTFGMAMKATWGQIDGKGIEIFKDPKTDSGFKKSAKGLLKVDKDENGNFCLVERSGDNDCFGDSGYLKPIFRDGRLIVKSTLSEIRERLENT